MMNFWKKLFARLAEISPYILVFSIICGSFGAYLSAAEYGAETVRRCLAPVLVSFIPAVIFAMGAYLLFGTESAEIRNGVRLGGFDRMLVYRCFGRDGYTKKLKNAVVDMHVMDFNSALDAMKELEEEKLSERQRSVLYFYMGRCYQLMGYPTNGAKYFLDAIDLGLKLNDTYLLAARCCAQNGSFDKALELYGVLVERDCSFDFIYTDMGIAYLKMGDGEKALEYFNISLDEGRNYAFALGGCSLAYLQMKDLEKSREYYQKALLCNMDDVSGFKIFYCNIAEAVGLIDEIDPHMKEKNIQKQEISL
ncbi:MAG: hypothetical protein J6C96_01320 [Oscillospiraceae bacterium]|nr:hypothetical protein [Oscillospiraceae bacterium]